MVIKPTMLKNGVFRHIGDFRCTKHHLFDFLKGDKNWVIPFYYHIYKLSLHALIQKSAIFLP